MLREILQTLLISIGLLTAGGCSLAQVAGGGSDTDAFTGVVADRSGAVKAGIEVMIFSQDYDSFDSTGFADTTVSDTDGRFHFASIPSGTYNVVCREPAAHQAGISMGIVSRSIRPDSAIVCTLQTTGEISGTVLRDGKPLEGSAFIIIRGTPFLTAVIEATGAFTLADVPPGRFQLTAVEMTLGSPHGGPAGGHAELNGPEVTVSTGSVTVLDSTAQNNWTRP
jgi:hypothetical protein